MLSYELQETVLRYINNEIDIEQLKDWLVPRLPIFLSSLDTPDANVADAIELGLAEMRDGIRTEDEVRQLLLDVVREQITVLVVYPPDRLYDETSGADNQALQVISDPFGQTAPAIIGSPVSHVGYTTW